VCVKSRNLIKWKMLRYRVACHEAISYRRNHYIAEWLWTAFSGLQYPSPLRRRAASNFARSWQHFTIEDCLKKSKLKLVGHNIWSRNCIVVRNLNHDNRYASQTFHHCWMVSQEAASTRIW
jgi:hypothetical protein